jgi:tetrapyrrole methylase family protein/MazG family protein
MTENQGQAVAGEIYVVGLGPGDPLDLPPVNLALMRGATVYLRTGRHPVVPYLEADGINCRTFDHLYEEADSFALVYQKITDFLLKKALEADQAVVFAVPGHPLVGETVVRHLLQLGQEQGIRVRLWPAPSFLEPIYLLLGLDPAQGLLVTDSFQFRCSCGQQPVAIDPDNGILIAQLYNRALASEVKLSLMEHFPDDHPVALVQSAGIRGQERANWMPLYELDRREPDHLTSVYVPPLKDTVIESGTARGVTAAIEPPEPETGKAECYEVVKQSLYPLDSLEEVMQQLLAPGGCPWDRQQTHQSLKKYVIEESYEVLDAIDEGDMHKLCEELGDLLLQVIFHTALAAGRGDFTLTEVVEGITAKLKRRHPHVFGETSVQDAAEVLVNWEAIKQREGKSDQERGPRSLLAGVPRYLPSLQRAQKVQGKAALVGFDWSDARSAAVKLEEEWLEVQDALAAGNQEQTSQELGDFFFAAVNVARLLDVDAEEALRKAADKFIRRFQRMEKIASYRGAELKSLSLGKMDAIWNEIKSKE